MEELYLGRCYVAFLDLVAFKDIVESDCETVMTGLSMALKQAESRTSFLNRSLGRGDVFDFQLNGDAVVLALRQEGSDVSDVMELIETVRTIQKYLLMRSGLLLRGGIAAGDLTVFIGERGRSFTGNGMSRASDVLGQENPSFLVAIDDSIMSDVSEGLMRIYPRSVVEGILSSKTIIVDGHRYVRYIDGDISSETVAKCIRFYRSHNPGNEPKIISRLIGLIDMHNEQNHDDPLDRRIAFESEDS